MRLVVLRIVFNIRLRHVMQQNIDPNVFNDFENFN